MEKYPDIQIGQFTVQFFDRNAGSILDHDFNHDRNDTPQKVYSIHNTLKNAIEYAVNRKASIEEGGKNIGYLIHDKKEKLVLHTDNLSKNYSVERKTIIINGNNFSEIEEFYNEVDNVLTSELEWKTGHNLNAFNDILQGGFGIHEYQEPIQLIWTNSVRSKHELSMLLDNKSFYQIIVEIIKANDHIEFIEKQFSHF